MCECLRMCACMYAYVQCIYECVNVFTNFYIYVRMCISIYAIYHFLESYVTAKAHLQTIRHRNEQLVNVCTIHSLHHPCMYINMITYIKACVRACARVFAFFDFGSTCYMQITCVLLCHFQSYIFTDRPSLYAR